MTDTSHNPTEPNWDETISETPRFKERLPAVFEQLARAINDRASDPATTRRTTSQRTKPAQRRTGIWRIFAWSTAMAMVMSLVSLMLLHSLVEERVRLDIETQNAAVKEEIAQMEREARERIDADFADMRRWVSEESDHMNKTVSAFRKMIELGNLPVSTIMFFRCVYAVQIGEPLEQAMARYQFDFENLEDLEVALLNVELPPKFRPSDYERISAAIDEQLAAKDNSSD